MTRQMAPVGGGGSPFPRLPLNVDMGRRPRSRTGFLLVRLKGNIVKLRERVRARAGERGAAALEFALVLPLLITLVFGMVDAGWAINRYSVLNNAVREGVRVASLGGDTNAVRAAVNNSLDGKMIEAAPVITVTCTKSNGAGGTCGSSDTSGGTAVVKAVVTVPWLTPVMATFKPSGVGLDKEMKMRIE